MIKNPQLALRRSWWLLCLGLLIYCVSSFYVWEQNQSPAITIGSKNFTESNIIAEYYAQVLEKAGYRVQRKFSLGGTFIAHQALKRGQIDFYPEYSGTAFLDILHHRPPVNSQESLRLLNQRYGNWGLRWLHFSPADDSFALVLRRETAKRYHLTTLSQLSVLAPKLILGSIPEFEERVDGLPGLKQAYHGFNFNRVELFDNGLKYQVLRDKRVDVTVGFTTDGPLADTSFISLGDDKHFWPDYHVAPVVRQDALNRIPPLQDILNAANSRLTNPTLRRLNAAVDLDHQDVRRVVRDFLAPDKVQRAHSHTRFIPGKAIAKAGVI